MPRISRRHFLAESAWLVPLVSAACAERVTQTPDEAPVDVEITTNAIRLRLARIPSLARDGGSFVVGEANVIVVRPSATEYRAFSNVCTHAGCGIYQFVAQRLRCQCHGSEFDADGINVAGPAPSPLTRLLTTLEEGGAGLRIGRG